MNASLSLPHSRTARLDNAPYACTASKRLMTRLKQETLAMAVLRRINAPRSMCSSTFTHQINHMCLNTSSMYARQRDACCWCRPGAAWRCFARVTGGAGRGCLWSCEDCMYVFSNTVLPHGPCDVKTSNTSAATKLSITSRVVCCPKCMHTWCNSVITLHHSPVNAAICAAVRPWMFVADLAAPCSSRMRAAAV